MNKWVQVNIIYVDFVRVFNHGGLLYKLSFSYSLASFFTSSLHIRPQNIVYNGFKSKIFRVPQGYKLGPMLLLLVIIDLIDVIDCRKYVFADALKGFLSISAIDDCVEQQCLKNSGSSIC